MLRPISRPAEISQELKASAACILVLTRDNLASSWMMFEAGAVSTTIDQAHVCPLVFGIEPTDVPWPLAQFQATKFTKADVRKLIETINSAAGNSRLPDPILDAVFEKWWSDLDDEVQKIMHAAPARGREAVRNDSDILREILQIVRNMQSALEDRIVPISGGGTSSLLSAFGTRHPTNTQRVIAALMAAREPDSPDTTQSPRSPDTGARGGGLLGDLERSPRLGPENNKKKKPSSR